MGINLLSSILHHNSINFFPNPDKEPPISYHNWNNSKTYKNPSPITTSMCVGYNFIDTTKIISIPYCKLKHFGLAIYNKPLPHYKGRPISRFKNQHCEYFIKKDNGGDYGKIPDGHTIFYCREPKFVRLVGKSILRVEDIPLLGELKPRIKKIINGNVWNRSSITPLVRKADIQEKSINELPILRSEDNTLICIPIDDNDPPTFGFYGNRGGGKSLALHTVADILFWRKPFDGDRIAILNSPFNQFYYWQMKNNNNYFNKVNSAFGHYPRPLPIVYVHPSNEEMPDGGLTTKKNEYYCSMPFQDAMKNRSYYFKGIKDWENYDKSDKYFVNILDELLKCSTKDEIISLVDESMNPDSANKIKDILDTMFRSKIFDYNTGVPSYWEVRHKRGETKKMLPMSALLECGLIPCIINDDIKKRHYYPQYMRWIIQDIYDNQNKKKFEDNKRLWCLFDEIGQLLTAGKDNVLGEQIVEMLTGGRTPNIATIFTNQSKEELDKRITQNTTYEFIFKTTEKCFNLDTEQKRELPHLPKLTCYAIPEHRFIAYHPDGRREEIDYAVKGEILFPMSRHYYPSTKKGDKDEEDIVADNNLDDE